MNLVKVFVQQFREQLRVWIHPVWRWSIIQIADCPRDRADQTNAIHPDAPVAMLMPIADAKEGMCGHNDLLASYHGRCKILSGPGNECSPLKLTTFANTLRQVDNR